MSKRAEEATKRIHNRALLEAEKYATFHGQGIVVEIAFGRGFKTGFIKGYEQAEKDTIERAVTWLKDNANKYIVDLTETYPDAPVNIIVGGMCWEDLTKYLKDNEQH